MYSLNSLYGVRSEFLWEVVTNIYLFFSRVKCFCLHWPINLLGRIRGVNSSSGPFCRWVHWDLRRSHLFRDKELGISLFQLKSIVSAKGREQPSQLSLGEPCTGESTTVHLKLSPEAHQYFEEILLSGCLNFLGEEVAYPNQGLRILTALPTPCSHSPRSEQNSPKCLHLSLWPCSVV